MVEAETALQQRREVSTRQEADQQRREGEITLLQNAFLGAVLMVLAAVQAFAYRIPFLAPPAVPALIALLGALALLLATLVLWLATPQETRGPGRFGALFAGLVGATAGWLGVTVFAHALTGRASSVLLTWAVASPSTCAAGCSCVGDCAGRPRGERHGATLIVRGTAHCLGADVHQVMKKWRAHSRQDGEGPKRQLPGPAPLTPAGGPRGTDRRR